MKKFAQFITKHSLFIVIISVFLLIPSVIGYINTKINYDILVYLPENLETIKGQSLLKEKYKMGAFAFVLTNSNNNKAILNLENEIKKINGVNKVISIADITDVSIPIEMLPNEILEKVDKGNETVILVTFNGTTSEKETLDAFENLRELAGSKKISGMSGMVVDTRDLSNKEMLTYVILAVIFSIIVLLFTTDSYIIPIFLLGNIGFAIIYNLGSNIIFGEISYITKAITAVLQLGVTMDFSIFLYNKYYQEKEHCKDNKGAMTNAICATFKSVLGSSLTTIAGFLALCGMSLTLGKDIGLVLAKGVLLGLLCVITLLPSLLLVFDKLIEKTKHKNIFPKFNKLQDFIIKKQKLIIILFLILLIPAVIGNSKVNVYYKLDNSLPKELPSRIADSTLKEKFNIISPEMILINKNIDANKQKKLIEEINNTKGIDLVISKNNIESLGIPLEMFDQELINIFESDKYELIIFNSTYEVASSELNNQLSDINQIVNKYDKNGIVAGEGALTKDLVEITDHDFKVVNYISIGIIFILMLLVLKSISLPVILVFVIEFAIFSNMSVAYFTGKTLPFIASIVVGTIQLGATIDYAILMSTTYLDERKKTKDKHKAIKNTLSKTMTSIIVSSFCFFAATFGVAIYSKIDMIGSICNLLSRGAVISMIVVCLLLPALLITFDKIILKTTYNMKEDL